MEASQRRAAAPRQCPIPNNAIRPSKSTRTDARQFALDVVALERVLALVLRHLHARDGGDAPVAVCEGGEGRAEGRVGVGRACQEWKGETPAGRGKGAYNAKKRREAAARHEGMAAERRGVPTGQASSSLRGAVPSRMHAHIGLDG